MSLTVLDVFLYGVLKIFAQFEIRIALLSGEEQYLSDEHV
jgi:hypothetical protein